MKKKDEIIEAYTRLRSTGAQPARLYGLAKVHKQGTPLRLVLSLPGSSYDNLIKTLAMYFEEIEGENMETNTQMAREILEKTELDSDDSIISLDVKSLYTNVPLKAAIDPALILLALPYSSSLRHAMPCAALLRPHYTAKLLPLATMGNRGQKFW